MRLFGLDITRAKALPSGVRLLEEANARGWRTIFEPYGGAWQADVTIDEEAVLANWVVFACMTLIAGDMGKMPLRLMERSQAGIWMETVSPAFSPVIRKPNRYQTRQKFIESWVFSKLSRGNALMLKERDNRGVVVGMHVLDWLRVTPLVAPNGDVYYRLGQDHLAGVTENDVVVPASEVIHDRMWCLFHPLVGVSPIYACGLAATQGLKIQGNSAKFFKNMSRPSGVLTAPAEISDAVAKRLKEEWTTNFAGDKIGNVAVLGDGLKYEAMSVTPEDAQLVQQLRLTAEMICTVFHVPGFKVGVGTAPALPANAEVMNQIYYSDCLQTQIESIEAVLDEGLGLTATGKDYGTEFDLNALIRMDSAAQIKALNEAVGGGWFKPDEARAARNLAPTPGGDTPYMQQQNYSLAALAKRDQGDPFPAPSPTLPPPPPPVEDQTDKVLGLLYRKNLEELTNA